MLETRRAVAAAAALGCTAALTVTPAFAAGPPGPAPAKTPGVKVLTEHLGGPGEVSSPGGRFLYVTESEKGQVTRIDARTGKAKAVVTGLDPNVTAGAIKIGNKYVVVTGEAGGPPEEGAPAGPKPKYPTSSVLVVNKKGKVRQLADLMKYELKHNPDGQRQFGKNKQPLDALSNPFYIVPDHRKGGYVLVADGGANDVLAVNRRGKVSTFFVPPNVNTGACKGMKNNDKKHPGCDSVPTGLAYGKGNRLYVSTAGGLVPGAGRVYVLNATTGKVRKVIKGLNAPTGVAVDKKGNVFVSEVMEGAPMGEEPPPPDFDPSTVGQITKVTPKGERSYAQVTMPLGLLWQHGRLYSSAWSIAGMMGMSDAGQLVRVGKRAFHKAA